MPNLMKGTNLEKLKKEFLKKFNLGRIKMSYLQSGDVFDGENYTNLLWLFIEKALKQQRKEIIKIAQSWSESFYKEGDIYESDLFDQFVERVKKI